MSIRPANQTDAAQISKLVRSLAVYYLDNPESELPSWLSESLTEKAFEMRFSSTDYLNLVYELNGLVAGYISVKLPGHLYHLFVAEKFQGQGLSRQLCEYFLEHSDCKTFSVRSSLCAIPVYKRFGFFESGPVGSRDGVSFQPMELRIT